MLLYVEVEAQKETQSGDFDEVRLHVVVCFEVFIEVKVHRPPGWPCVDGVW